MTAFAGSGSEQEATRAASVFRLSPTGAVVPSDLSLAASVLSDKPDGIPDNLLPGDVDADSARLLLADMGSTHANLYVMPTSKGKVCYVATGGPATCVDAFTPENPIAWTVWDPDDTGSGHPVKVLGLVPDWITSVQVKVHGVAHDATVRNGAFFYELGKSDSTPEAIVASDRSGKSVSIALGPMAPLDQVGK